ncbi:hypothetical protein LguiA_035254 [Lonicera macranthoides]
MCHQGESCIIGNELYSHFSRTEDVYYLYQLLHVGWIILIFSHCYKLKHGYFYICSLYESCNFHGPFWNSQEGNITITNMLVMLFRVMVRQLLSDFGLCACFLLQIIGRCSFYWNYFYLFSMQEGVNIEIVTREMSLFVGILRQEGIPLEEMQEASTHLMVRVCVLCFSFYYRGFVDKSAGCLPVVFFLLWKILTTNHM